MHSEFYSALKFKMPPQSWQKLWLKNAHPRDKDIVFDEPTHIYTIKGSSKGYISCTGFLHAFFGHFDPDAIIKKMMSSPKWPSSKYYGQTAAEIKAGWAKKWRGGIGCRNRNAF